MGNLIVEKIEELVRHDCAYCDQLTTKLSPKNNPGFRTGLFMESLQTKGMTFCASEIAHE